jgi:SAM-dependent methyltransferase
MRYATDPPMAIATLLDGVRPGMSPGGRLCELGFGAGWLLEELAREYPDVDLFGLDLSREHIDMLRPGVSAIQGDIEHLPFRPRAFDAVVTCWTLYFMRDIGAALAGIRECIRQDGVFVAATIAPDHMLEFDELVAAALAAVGAEPEPDISDRFNTVNGLDYVRRQFPKAELREWRGTLTVDDLEPLLLLWPGYGPQHVDAGTNARAREEFRRLAAARIDRDGSLVIRRHDGAFIATVV